MVDAYVKVEEDRLDFQRWNQKELRAESYRGLTDFLAADAERQGVQPGRQIILASSFIGGPRAMHQSYQDAMAICRHLGKPDLFITVTGNPKWLEIEENLGGMNAVDRPDIVSRVFKLKLDAIVHDLLRSQVPP